MCVHAVICLRHLSELAFWPTFGFKLKINNKKTRFQLDKSNRET